MSWCRRAKVLPNDGIYFNSFSEFRVDCLHWDRSSVAHIQRYMMTILAPFLLKSNVSKTTLLIKATGNKRVIKLEGNVERKLQRNVCVSEVWYVRGARVAPWRENINRIPPKTENNLWRTPNCWTINKTLWYMWWHKVLRFYCYFLWFGFCFSPFSRCYYYCCICCVRVSMCLFSSFLVNI